MLTNNGNVVVQSSSYFLAYLLILHPVQPLEEPNVVSGVKSSDNCCATRKFGSFQLFFKYLNNNIWSKRNPLLTSFFFSSFSAAQKDACSAKSNRHLTVFVLLKMHSELSTRGFLKVAKFNFSPSNSY